jgi:hypothetical protein
VHFLGLNTEPAVEHNKNFSLLHKSGSGAGWPKPMLPFTIMHDPTRFLWAATCGALLRWLVRKIEGQQLTGVHKMLCHSVAADPAKKILLTPPFNQVSAYHGSK